MGKQIDSLKHEESTVAGRKMVQLIQALQEVQGKIKLLCMKTVGEIRQSSALPLTALNVA
jgi:hypothetical protein